MFREPCGFRTNAREGRQIHARSSPAGDRAGLRRLAVRVRYCPGVMWRHGCVFPDNLRAVHERVRGPKRLVWSEGTQTDFYDQPAQVDVSIDAVDTFLEGRL